MPKQEKPLTKSQIIDVLVERMGLSKKEVVLFLATHATLMNEQLKMRGIEVYTIPFMGIKVGVIKKPATKARMGRNPQTGEAVKIAAKPARKVVKARVMKALKDEVLG